MSYIRGARSLKQNLFFIKFYIIKNNKKSKLIRDSINQLKKLSKIYKKNFDYVS